MLVILYHVRTEKSNVFHSRTKNFFKSQKVIDKPVQLCLNVNNIEKDFDGKFCFSQIQFREPVGGVNRCGSKGRSDSRVGPVNGVSSVMGPVLPR